MYLHFDRKDQRRPVKKLVQPTVVSQAGETNNPQSAVSSENPVATAAAIAAAAASAATGPFLQVISYSLYLKNVSLLICRTKIEDLLRHSSII